MRQSLVALRKAAVLSSSSVQRELELLNASLPIPRWTLQSTESQGRPTSELEGHYSLKTFAKTWEFLNIAASHAQTARHHPTITTTYNRIKFTITTHDEGNQVTDKDIKLAWAIENTFKNHFVPKAPVKTGESLSSWMEASAIINDLTKKAQ